MNTVDTAWMPERPETDFVKILENRKSVQLVTKRKEFSDLHEGQITMIGSNRISLAKEPEIKELNCLRSLLQDEADLERST